MKKIFLAILGYILFSASLIAQSVGINNPTPDASSILDVKSNSKGVLLQRTSTISRLAIVTPAEGYILTDSLVSAFSFYSG